ncbi:hypothetical protein [Sedimentibacter sp.]|uniref:hypothetical protein n=1 Tax=Sedimentibacter sp. TaxID=1960295 RepID=UPI0028A8F540|nr:hypothetical protein [Sedimentibacter sp.]
MSLTREDLKAISDLIEVKLNEQESRMDQKFEAIDQRFDKVDQKFEAIDQRFDDQDKKFEEMLINNNFLIAEHVQRVVSESEQRLMTEIREIKSVTMINSYEIAKLKSSVH